MFDLAKEFIVYSDTETEVSFKNKGYRDVIALTVWAEVPWKRYALASTVEA